MTDYGTIKIPTDTFDEHNRRRKDAGLTWEQYLDEEAVEIEHGTDALAQAVAERFDYAAVADRVAEQVVADLEGMR